MKWINKLILKLTQWAYDCDGMCGHHDICVNCNCNPENKETNGKSK